LLRFVNQHYTPDVASTGQHLTDLAEYLSAAGVPVEVVTGRAHYAGGMLDAPATEVRAGVRIRRYRTAGLGRRSRGGRIFDYAMFYGQVAWTSWIGDAADGTVYLTTPPLLGVIGWIGKAARGRRYGIWSMDLHPDAEVAAGMLRPGSVVSRVLNWLNDRGYRHADFIVDLGPYMQKRILSKGVGPERVATVPVWGAAPQESPAVAATGESLRARLGLESATVVMYSGNAGVVHEFGPILEAMRLMRDERDVHFVFAGGGPRRAEIEAYARSHALRNFTYIDYVAREELAGMLAAADVHLISLRSAFAGISVPGKLYGIMAAARPALFVGPAACETADTIRSADCGEIVDPAIGDAASRVAATIRGWRANPESARAAGARGLAAYMSRYQRGPNCAAFARVIEHAWPSMFTTFTRTAPHAGVTASVAPERATDADADDSADVSRDYPFAAAGVPSA
jgi:colanic acid biosynthesis glycosyl transferase WcaI